MSRDCSERWSGPPCSVVICTRDRPEILGRCLESLTHQDYGSFEVLVVDNAPSDERTREQARHWGSRYTVEPVPGLSRARNRGLAQCESEIVAYIDDDAVAQPGWLGGLVREFDDPEVMAVTGRIAALGDGGDEQNPWAAMLDRGPVRRSFDTRDARWFELANFGAIGIGANMALRRRIVEVWRGFDPRLGRGSLVPGGEENYAFCQIISLGYRVIYTPAAVVRHHTPLSYQEARAWHLEVAGSVGAYLAFLMAEQPQHRMSIARLLLTGLRRRPPASAAGADPARLAPRWRQLLAAFSGAGSYMGKRLWQKRFSTLSKSS
jgi:cellulose synthase/poly-beta-1,6-N-acetylglucosamine synthase-like glycosyltransferase